jgi:Cu-processing system permease protein
MSAHARLSPEKSGGLWQIAAPQIRNVMRSRWLLCYLAFFLLATEGLLRFTGGDERTLLSLANVVLFIVPMVTVVYGTIYLYGSREFIELLLAQPLKRRTVYAGLYLGLALPLAAAFVSGVAAPFLVHGMASETRMPLATMLIGGTALTLIFTGIAFCVALRFEDRLTGLGAGLAVWLMFGLVYDGVMLFVVAVLVDHTIEKPLLAALLVNPIDLVRVALLLQFDVSALMGYTGAVFKSFFAGSVGIAVIAAALMAWIAMPLAAGLAAFNRKDF